jgi:hypothetical protein
MLIISATAIFFRTNCSDVPQKGTDHSQTWLSRTHSGSTDSPAGQTVHCEVGRWHKKSVTSNRTPLSEVLSDFDHVPYHPLWRLIPPPDGKSVLSSVTGITNSTKLHFTFHGSKVGQNDCRMWNKSYNYKNTYTVQLKHSKVHTYIYKSNTVNLHYVHKPLKGWVSFRQ